MCDYSNYFGGDEGGCECDYDSDYGGGFLMDDDEYGGRYAGQKKGYKFVRINSKGFPVFKHEGKNIIGNVKVSKAKPTNNFMTRASRLAKREKIPFQEAIQRLSKKTAAKKPAAKKPRKTPKRSKLQTVPRNATMKDLLERYSHGKTYDYTNTQQVLMDNQFCGLTKNLSYDAIINAAKEYDVHPGFVDWLLNYCYKKGYHIKKKN